METMQAIELIEPGGPGMLRLGSAERPVPGAGEVLIEVVAAGVNRPDCLQRKGAYPPPPGASEILGLEVAGTIVAVGDGVSDGEIGRKVMALISGGGYAGYATANVLHVLDVPGTLNMAQAAAFPETFFTVWHNVFQRGELKAGDVFLVHGGTSGIGTTAIQLAKAFGAKVIATAGSEEKRKFCEDLGADLAINYREDDFVEAARKFTDGRGVDLILDMVGGPYIDRNLDVAAVEGRLVQIAFLQGPKAEVDFRKLMQKRLNFTGSTLRARSVEFKEVLANELRDQVLPLVEAGKIKPVMDQVFALKDASLAHARMEQGDHIGKIVLEL
ncbi:NAD(P)H-quinone oxidoreductase [Ruegeria jejuensis]|uniref:NAD(P)H-quinone oxidoreductase n=1 Tax=Ruegeria jejuensis TaxID=3233338 RepID=UPI00355B107A